MLSRTWQRLLGKKWTGTGGDARSWWSGQQGQGDGVEDLVLALAADEGLDDEIAGAVAVDVEKLQAQAAAEALERRQDLAHRPAGRVLDAHPGHAIPPERHGGDLRRRRQGRQGRWRRRRRGRGLHLEGPDIRGVPEDAHEWCSALVGGQAFGVAP